MRTQEEIVDILRDSFKPLICGVEVWDYNEKIRFKVHDPEGKIVAHIKNIPVRLLQKPDDLRILIEGTRQEIEKKGFKLNKNE